MTGTSTDMQKQMKRFERGFRKYPRVLAQEMRIGLERTGQAWHAAMVKRVSGRSAQAFPSRSPANKLNTRSGMLRRSLHVEMGPKKGTEVSMALTSRGTRYAAAQEFGAHITPKSAKWLWIPMEGNVTPTGRTRKPPRLLMNQKENLYFHKVKGKDAMVVYLTHKWMGGKGRSGGTGDRRKQKKMVAMFYLKKRVTIPGPQSTGATSRFGFFDTWKKDARRRREEFAEAVYRAGVEVARRSAAG